MNLPRQSRRERNRDEVECGSTFPLEDLPFPAEERRLGWRAGGAIVVCVSVWTLGWLLPSPGILQGLDYIRYYFFNAYWLQHAVHVGEFPWWNPHVGLGRPFFADLQTGVYYPPNWLHILLGPAIATIVLAWGHALLGAWATARFAMAVGCARGAATVAGVLFVVGSPLAARFITGQVHYAIGACYLPLIWWLSVRLQRTGKPPAVAILGIASGLQLLCGHPQIYWITHFGLGVFLLVMQLGRPWRRAVGVLLSHAAAFGLGLLLTAPVLLPFLELVQQGNRSAAAPGFSALGSIAASEWWTVLLAPSAVTPVDIESQLFQGSLVAAAAGAALLTLRDRISVALATVAASAAVLAADIPSAVRDVADAVLPGLAAFRMPARFGVLLAFGLLMLAARWFSIPTAERRHRQTWWGMVILLLSGAAIFFWAHQDDAAKQPIVAIAIVAMTVGALGGALFLSGSGSALRSKIGGALCVAAIGGELILASTWLKRAYIFPTDYPAETVVREMVANLHKAGGIVAPPRINISARLLRENSGMITGHSTFNGYVSLYLERVWFYLHAAAGLEPSGIVNTFPDVRIFERGPFPYESMNLIGGFDVRTRELQLNSDPDPRAYLVGETASVPHWRDAVTKMAAGHDFHRVALVEPDGPRLVGGVAVRNGAAIMSFSANTVRLVTRSPVPSLLVLAEAWYPGWRVTVNGRPEQAFPVNGWMRGVRVPAGEAVVEWRFEQQWYGWGALAGLIAVALCIVLWRWPSPEVRRSEASRISAGV